MNTPTTTNPRPAWNPANRLTAEAMLRITALHEAAAYLRARAARYRETRTYFRGDLDLARGHRADAAANRLQLRAFMLMLGALTQDERYRLPDIQLAARAAQVTRLAA